MRVTVLLGREEADGAFDVTEVLAQPGGGPPPPDTVSSYFAGAGIRAPTSARDRRPSR